MLVRHREALRRHARPEVTVDGNRTAIFGIAMQAAGRTVPQRRKPFWRGIIPSTGCQARVLLFQI